MSKIIILLLILITIIIFKYIEPLFNKSKVKSNNLIIFRVKCDISLAPPYTR